MTIFGFAVPDAGPVFVTALTVHVMAGLWSTVAGAGAALVTKGSRVHLWCGRAYLVGLAAVFTSAVVMAVLRWPLDNTLVVIGSVAATAGLIGLVDRRSAGTTTVRLGSWSVRDGRHLVAMGISYSGMLTAFYVDNAARLPLWSTLPPWLVWVLPGLIGSVLVLRAARRRRVRPER